MKLELRKYFWALNLLTILLCTFFAAKGCTTLLATGIPQPKSRRVRLSAPGAGTMAHGARDVSGIIGRNIFCSTCEKEKEIAGAGTEGDDEATETGEPVKSSLNLKLLATLVSDQDRAWSYAAIKDPEADKTRMFAIGQNVAESAVIEDILDRRVILRNGGRPEYLELEVGDDGGGAPPPKTAKPPPRRRSSAAVPDDISKGVRKLGDNKWEIQRNALNKVLGNTTLLARSARIVPSVRNGKPNGFKLYAIRPGSIYSLIGMQNGDTIHAINGHQINTPDKALEIYTKVRNASHLSIDFTRRSKSQTHDYVIR